LNFLIGQRGIIYADGRLSMTVIAKAAWNSTHHYSWGDVIRFLVD
jgi:hypothetical protein